LSVQNFLKPVIEKYPEFCCNSAAFFLTLFRGGCLFLDVFNDWDVQWYSGNDCCKKCKVWSYVCSLSFYIKCFTVFLTKGMQVASLTSADAEQFFP
jgi:hypothetical protein